MRTAILRLTLTLAATLAAGMARADICDYRLSQFLTRNASPAVNAASEAARTQTGTGDAMLYILVDPRTGRAHVGATEPGDAGADDGGLLASTARLLGSAVALVGRDSPLLSVGSAAVSLGAEAFCRFGDERITEYDDVLDILRTVDLTMPPDLFAVVEPGLEEHDAFIRLSRNDGFGLSEYRVDQLYIVNGTLMHRQWGVNEVVGDIAIFMR
ncbi:hypothetical protein [Pararhodobacter marinus]|uniref:hypothetical protein n=1 Tax=Pararhodobacter marinus TaxID=2184063 RepID=UPI0035196D9C